MIAEEIQRIMSPESLTMSAPAFVVPTYPRGRKTIAYHEAAHAVLCEVFDIPYLGAELDRDFGDFVATTGRVNMDTAHIAQSAEQTRDIPIPPDSLNAVMFPLVAMYLAGKMGELLAHGIRPDGLVEDDSPDFKNATKLLAEYYEPLPLYACQRFAVLVLDHNWAWVSKVAEALDEKGRLSKSEIIQLFGQAYPSS